MMTFKKKKVRGIERNEYGDFIVRLYHGGKQYPKSNYTKKYGCNTLLETEEMVLRIKMKLDKDENPFDTSRFGEHIEEYFDGLKESTRKIYKSIYNKHAKKHLHHLYVSRIAERDIKKIYEDMIRRKNKHGIYEINSQDTLEKIRSILLSVFKGLKKKNLIEINYVENYKVPEINRDKELMSLSLRLKDQDYIEVVQKLYRGIKKIEHDGIRNYLLLTLMTSRRRSEVFRTTKNHINGNVVSPTKNMTKTKIDDRYIIPEELVEYVNSTDKEIPFKCDVHAFGRHWKRVLEEQNIDFLQQFRVYDTRHLFISIMRKKYNRDLVGACISHYKGDTNDIYISYEFKDRKEVFEEYWKIVRGE